MLTSITRDFEEWADTDKVFSYFFQTCLEAGPEKCPLAALNKSAAELEADSWTWLESIRKAPIAAGTTIVDFAGAKGFLAETLKSPSKWSNISQILTVAIYGSDEEREGIWNLVNSTSLPTEGPESPSSLGTLQSVWGIHCGDRVPRIDSFEGMEEVADKLTNTSRLIGDVIQVVTTHCAQWPWHAKEVYKGDFHVKTKNPVLLVGNILDAHTPIRSAFNVSQGLERSEVLTVNGTGVRYFLQFVPPKFPTASRSYQQATVLLTDIISTLP